MAIRLPHVAEAIAAQNLLDPLGGRIGIEHQVHFGLRLPIVAEGVVQQVIENLAVQFGFAAIIALKTSPIRNGADIWAVGGVSRRRLCRQRFRGR